jgi:hypothetical protein
VVAVDLRATEWMTEKFCATARVYPGNDSVARRYEACLA